MKIYSWNVNGWRAIWKKDFCVFLRREKPDILCLQEIKINPQSRSGKLRVAEKQKMEG